MKVTDIFNMVVQSGLFAVLLGLVVSGVKCAKTFVDAKTLEATQRVKDANLRNAIDTLENGATAIVAELAQTSADDLKAKSADGKLTPDDAAKLKADAISNR